MTQEIRKLFELSEKQTEELNELMSDVAVRENSLNDKIFELNAEIHNVLTNARKNFDAQSDDWKQSEDGIRVNVWIDYLTMFLETESVDVDLPVIKAIF